MLTGTWNCPAGIDFFVHTSEAVFHTCKSSCPFSTSYTHKDAYNRYDHFAAIDLCPAKTKAGS